MVVEEEREDEGARGSQEKTSGKGKVMRNNVELVKKVNGVVEELKSKRFVNRFGLPFLALSEFLFSGCIICALLKQLLTWLH